MPHHFESNTYLPSVPILKLDIFQCWVKDELAARTRKVSVGSSLDLISLFVPSNSMNKTSIGVNCMQSLMIFFIKKLYKCF